MIDQGDIALADLNLETRRRVLVLSNRRFHQLTGRVLVAPQEEPEPFPWRIAHDDGSFAVDLVKTVASENLAEVVGAVSVEAMRKATSALRFITS